MSNTYTESEMRSLEYSEAMSRRREAIESTMKCEDCIYYKEGYCKGKLIKNNSVCKEFLSEKKEINVKFIKGLEDIMNDTYNPYNYI
jgi:hypothetical protein